VRLLNNPFYQEIQAIYERNGTPEELAAHLGRGRAKKGMFEGDLVEGELEIGQIAGLIDSIQPAAQIIAEMVAEFESCAKHLPRIYN
jgi:enoyl-[acyl-carrier protein] reductase II